MPLSNEVREKLELYLLEHIDRDDKELVKKTAGTFSVSRTTIYQHLKRMEERGEIQRAERACRFALIDTKHFFQYFTSQYLEEDQIFRQDIQPFLVNLPQNVYDIWYYCFTEIMNNAIEHAEASLIRVLVTQNRLHTEICIFDDGVGIFRKIQTYYAEELHTEISLSDASNVLFPGKFTTDKSRHTGEGIFFSSQAVDRFIISSDGEYFTRNSFKELHFSDDMNKLGKGTFVIMTLSNTSNKDNAQLMNYYTDPERGFYQTKIPVAHMFENGYPISRSEARRLATYIQTFETVTLDFHNVEKIGQAFAHELFVVFQNAHPKITLKCENANEAVENMIRRVKNS